jgi:hypothetical protein
LALLLQLLLLLLGLWSGLLLRMQVCARGCLQARDRRLAALCIPAGFPCGWGRCARHSE